MRTHHQNVEVTLLAVGSDFIARVTNQAHFFGFDAGFFEKRQHRINGFGKFALLQLDHFVFRQSGQCHAGHIRHNGTGVVAHGIDQVNLGALTTEEVQLPDGVLHSGRTELGTVHSDAYA